MTEFKKFSKIPRLNRECVITEKIDGTNASVIISDDGSIAAASRSKIITPDDDNHGFAAWVRDNASDLMALGPGNHFGEWWGLGIQKRYSGFVSAKMFWLFNVGIWNMGNLPTCCGVVPIVTRGKFSTEIVESALERLRTGGSIAAPGCMRPEGIIVFHTAANQLFKVTLEKDDEWKGPDKNPPKATP